VTAWLDISLFFSSYITASADGAGEAAAAAQTSKFESISTPAIDCAEINILGRGESMAAL
jgi:hypothetical protein